MILSFPSPEFDDAVAAVCHGSATEAETRALNALLRSDSSARDEYLMRVEVHSRLASEPDLFTPSAYAAAGPAMFDIGLRNRRDVFSPNPEVPARRRTLVRVLALAACLIFIAAGVWSFWFRRPATRNGATSTAVAMLARAVDAGWGRRTEPLRVGSALEPGWLRLESGMAQVVFYSGARVVIEGPTELQLNSQSEASCRTGRLTAEVPPQARGFRIGTPQMKVTDLGTSFGLDVKDRRTELHVFKGSVELQAAADAAKQKLQEGAGAVIEGSRPFRLIAASPAAFASLFDLQTKSVAAEAQRHEQWRTASGFLNRDPSLLVHFDFENVAPSGWRLYNVCNWGATASEGTVVGCQWTEGRWPDKPALEFRGVSDRVRLSVPGEFEALTLAAWVRVQGLDRQFNSLFMCDGFNPGAVHWLIRNDGVLGLTVIGPGSGDFQILASPPVLTLDRLGLWVHLAVVLDGRLKRVAHYVNGLPVSEKALRLNPPFSIGAAELGNWNASGSPGNDPSLIRNFSGAMDEFCLFNRGLNADEIRALYSEGKPQPDSVEP